MSKLLINQYYNQLDKVKQYGGSYNETSIRNSFFNLLNEYAHKKNLELIPELATMGTRGKTVRPDGILKNALRLEYGLWESKDEKTNLDDEIEVKIRLGYSLKNILFEDSQTAVLYQNDFEVSRINMKDAEKLDKILNEFVNFEKPEVKEFNTALEHFKQDIPTIINTLRDKIEAANKDNKKYITARNVFLELCQKEINPEITADDIREMIIQHILTADIFNVVFDEPHFHRENNIARELEGLIDTFFTGNARRNVLESINHYYKAINVAASSIADHHEKQKFLKVIYENFYKVYNPKAADRLGVVYTPNEIVTFMLESTNYLLDKHFGKTLGDKNVEILDPATGTGTFITELIDGFIPKKDLAYKYQNEIHCNEVSILPYYIANLNIEYTFKQKMGYYEEFKNICFVDTLDNIDALHYSRRQHDLFGLSSENTDRIRRQNKKKISVIIGNPPYNANQQNENDNNKKRDYKELDERIKDTYVKHSTSQKTKVYDMYARFFRWATDRVATEGVISFITNNSFINARGFDGFRRSVQNEFDYAFIIDLDGDVRSNPAQAKANVFGIMVGVSIAFLIKVDNKTKKNCKIKYFRHASELAKEKIEFLINHTGSSKLNDIPFDNILPNNGNNWLNISDNDFETLLPLTDKKSKRVLFEVTSNGISTNRDEWVYDFNRLTLTNKAKFFINEYNSELKR
jgi:predicted helicase